MMSRRIQFCPCPKLPCPAPALPCPGQFENLGKFTTLAVCDILSEKVAFSMTLTKQTCIKMIGVSRSLFPCRGIKYPQRSTIQGSPTTIKFLTTSLAIHVSRQLWQQLHSAYRTNMAAEKREILHVRNCQKKILFLIASGSRRKLNIFTGPFDKLFIQSVHSFFHFISSFDHFVK